MRLLCRPTQAVGGLRFYRDSSSIYLSCFFRPLPSEIAERNSSKTDHMFGSECDLKLYVRNKDYLFPYYKQGNNKHLFRQLCNLTANLTAYIFGTKRDIHNRASALALRSTTWGLLHRLKMS